MRIISSNKSILSGIILVTFILLLIVPTIWFERNSYDSLLTFIIQKLNRPDLYTLFRNKLFTKERYDTICKFHWIIYPIIIALIILAIKLKKVLDNLLSFIYLRSSNYGKSTILFFKNQNKTQRLIFILVIIIYFILSFYKILNRGITYDEAWNYNYFIGKPPYFSFILFNTYPLYHFIASIIDFLHFDPCVSGRVISALTGSFFLVSIYLFTSKNYRLNSAVLVLFIILASPFFIVFSAIIKGVILCIAISFIHFYATIQYVKNRDNKSYLFIYLISSFLNILSMPTAIIFSIASCVYIIIQQLNLTKKEWLPILKIILYSTATILISLLFYLPIVFSSGKEKILGVENSGEYANIFLSYFYLTSKLFWGNQYLNIILFVVGIIALLFSKNKNEKIMLGYSITIIVITCLFFIYKKTPDRSIAFLFIPYLTIIIYIINTAASIIGTSVSFIYPIISCVIIITLIIPIYNYSYEFVYPKGIDKTLSKRISNLLLDKHVSSCYVQNADFWINYPEIEYYYSRKKQYWNMNNNQDWSTRYKPYSVKDKYDCIITDSSNKFTVDSSYTMGWKENDFKIYFKKSK